MRENKYRGKSLNNGKWIFGSLLLINDKAYIYPSNSGDLEDIDFGFGFIEVDPATVGQFTSLFDKDGREIYEGDVLETAAGIRTIVEWNTDAACWCERYIDSQTCIHITKGTISEMGLHIIGNIHDK